MLKTSMNQITQTHKVMKYTFTPDADQIQIEYKRTSGGHSGIPLALIEIFHPSFGTVEKWVSPNENFDGPEDWEEVRKIADELLAKEARTEEGEDAEDFGEQLKEKGGKMEADGGVYELIKA